MADKEFVCRNCGVDVVIINDIPDGTNWSNLCLSCYVVHEALPEDRAILAKALRVPVTDAVLNPEDRQQEQQQDDEGSASPPTT